jgi:hypothetical protein
LDDDSGSGSGNALSGSARDDGTNAVARDEVRSGVSNTAVDDSWLLPSGGRQEAFSEFNTVSGSNSQWLLPLTDETFAAAVRKADAVLSPMAARLANDKSLRAAVIDQVLTELETDPFEGNLLRSNLN